MACGRTHEPEPLKLATYNVEWFNSLFDDRGTLLDDNNWSGRQNVRRAEQIAALGVVFRAMDADAVLVIEAPDQGRRRATATALETFAARFELRARKVVMGFPNDTQQEIALLYDPDRLSARHDPVGIAGGQPGAATLPRFDGVQRIALQAGEVTEVTRFSKPPLEMVLVAHSGQRLRLIGVHLKSKAAHGVHDAAQAIREAILNRRKHLAQCLWLRQRVLAHLQGQDPLIVLGDFNDGPGLDRYERQFGRSGLEIVLGWDEPHAARMFDPHATMALNHKLGIQPASARFYLAEQKRFFSAMLDYVMVSPDLRQRGPVWRIWHPFDDPVCFAAPALRAALLAASDHFPVSLDLASEDLPTPGNRSKVAP